MQAQAIQHTGPLHPTMGGILMSKAIDGYLVECQAELKSKDTISKMERHVKDLMAFLGGDRPIDSLSANDIRQYLKRQHERGIADYTVWSYYKRLKAFLRWCWKEGLMTDNIMSQLAAPRLPQLLPKVLTNEQVEQLFKQLRRDSSPLGHRNFVIVATFLDCGIRSNELSSLTLADVSLSELYLMIRMGKWRKQRPVPISPTMKRYLWRYMNEWREHLRPHSEYLFVNHEGKQLIPSGLQSMVRRQLQDIGVKGSTHILRHTFATMYLRNGGDLERLRLILGHTSLTVTQRYAHLLPEDLIKRHSEVSPLESALRQE